jgi:hypothetical protein
MRKIREYAARPYRLYNVAIARGSRARSFAARSASPVKRNAACKSTAANPASQVFITKGDTNSLNPPDRITGIIAGGSLHLSSSRLETSMARTTLVTAT